MNLNEREREQIAFNEFLKIRGIRVALFDFDDTLIKTNEIFGRQFDTFIKHLVERSPDRNPNDLREHLTRVSSAVYLNHGVNPKVWNMVVEGMEGVLESPGSCTGGLQHFMDIYTIVPEFQEGAEDTLQAFSSAGSKMGLVTHANPEWTDFKLTNLNMRRYFAPEHIIIADQDRHKGAEDWQTAMERFQVRGEEVIVVGDSLMNDIHSADAAGIQHKVWIPSSWKTRNQGEVPEGTIVVDRISNLVSTLASKA